MTNKIYNVKNLTVDHEKISFELSGHKIEVPLSISGSKILPEAKLEYLQIFELDDAGLGIHWPILDEDLSISGLLRSIRKENLVVAEIKSIYLDETPEAGTDYILNGKKVGQTESEVSH